jgi:hypothetical protein
MGDRQRIKRNEDCDAAGDQRGGNGWRYLRWHTCDKGNTLTPGIPASIVIKLLASTPLGLSGTGTGGTCSAASPTSTPAGPGVAGSLVPGMRAWGTTIHALPTIPVTYGLTETAFLPSSLSPAEPTELTLFCGFIQANGSGFGILQIVQDWRSRRISQVIKVMFTR